MTTPRRTARGVPTAATLVLRADVLTAGCGRTPGAEETAMPGSTSDATAPPAEPGPTASSGQPAPSPTPAGPTAAPGGTPAPEVEDLPVPTPSGRSVTVSGTVAAGVESGCLVLTSGGRTYLLLGSHEGPTPGASVTVEGTLVTDVLTTRQQGTPLQVPAVRAR